MVYPTLKINRNVYTVEIYDTEFTRNDKPIMVLQGHDTEETILHFLCLLDLFTAQYDCGYIQGSLDGYNDEFEEDDIE